MGRFDDCMGFVLEHECEYSDDPDDPGGETCFGVSRRAWPEQADEIIKLHKSGRKDEARQRAIDFYRAEFWAKLRGEKLRPPLDLSLFDVAVNMGLERAVRLLQLECNRQLGSTLKLDGILGPATLRTLGATPATLAAVGLCGQRLKAYTKLSRPVRQANLAGWVSRTADLILEIAAPTKNVVLP